MDLFSQCAFLSKDALGFTSYYAFRGRYSIVAHRMLGPKTFTEITGYKKLDELTDKLEKFSSRILKSECLDLPEKIYLRRDVILSQEQARAYTQMHKLALAKLDNGELATTASVLTQIMRLQQICCGFLQPDEGDLKVFPNKRLDSLMEIIEETQGKAIIWATYTFDIKNIAKVLRAKFGASAVATYYGETPQDERQEIVTKFQDPNSDLLFFVGQPKTGGYGITLTAASTVIYYSNSYDLEIRLQSEDRAHRIGQKKAVTYIDLVSPGTIDEKILSALRSKINLASIVLNEDPRKWL
jgi:SNF2 family DNA or RNA helicase